MQVYTPYLLINKTGCDFALKTKTFLSSAKAVAGSDFAPGKKDDVQPFMFSFPNEDRRNRVLLRINDSAWSKVRNSALSRGALTNDQLLTQPLSFETVGVETEVVVPSASGDEEIHIGMKVTDGLGDVSCVSCTTKIDAHHLSQQYKLTKVVTIYPRFILKNDLEQAIRVREMGSKETMTVPPGERYSLGFLRAGGEPRIVLSYPSGPTEWYVASFVAKGASLMIPKQGCSFQDSRYRQESRSDASWTA